MDQEFHIKIYDKLEKVKEGIEPSDFRFYNISHFPLLAKYTFEHAASCAKCNENIAVLNQIIDSLPEALTTGPTQRKEFEEKKTAIESHLKKKHHMRFPGHYTSLFSFTFVIVAILASILTNLLLKKTIFNDLTLIAISVGLISGILLGKKIDHRIFKKNLQL